MDWKCPYHLLKSITDHPCYNAWKVYVDHRRSIYVTQHVSYKSGYSWCNYVLTGGQIGQWYWSLVYCCIMNFRFKDEICDWIYGNHSKSHIGSYEIINFKDFKTLVSTWMKLTQKVVHFTVFKSFPNTSCCSQKFLPNHLEKIGWLDMRGSNRDVFIGWGAGDGLAGKGYSSKLW